MPIRQISPSGDFARVHPATPDETPAVHGAGISPAGKEIRFPFSEEGQGDFRRR
jgi:hypothetical protein